jgi:hypothetical protein
MAIATNKKDNGLGLLQGFFLANFCDVAEVEIIHKKI